jgi:pseudouridine 5'-phosphatase
MTAPSGLPPIKACLFDVDGLLINSEDIYTTCTNLILHEYNRPNLPWNVKARLQGRPGPESHRLLQEWAQLPHTTDEFFTKMRAHQKRLFPETEPLPGVEVLLNTLTSQREKDVGYASGTELPVVEMAVATSSNRPNFELKTSHLPHILSFFPPENVVLGDDERVKPGRGKPAPDIYLLALQTINDRRAKAQLAEIYPEECLVFEDAVPGVEAGRRAGMQVAWVPHIGLLGEYKGREKEVLAGLTGEHVEAEDEGGEKIDWETLQKEWVANGRIHARVRGKPGVVDDGWARLYDNLENFPLQYYGIKV